jgi:hypothetical protein
MNNRAPVADSETSQIGQLGRCPGRVVQSLPQVAPPYRINISLHPGDKLLVAHSGVRGFRRTRAEQFLAADRARLQMIARLEQSFRLERAFPPGGAFFAR